MHSRTVPTVLLLAACILSTGVALAQQSEPAPASSSNLTADQQALFASAQTDFKAAHYSDALRKLRQLHEQVPDNQLIAKFGAEAAVNTGDFATASALLQPILKASPDDPQALGIQAHLYGQEHDAANRDALLDRLQKLHDAGKISLPTVIVEKDPLPQGGLVTITYFLQPWSQFHIALMAEFRDSSGRRTQRIALESDDIDQVRFSQEHPADAAAGVRIYSMDSYSEKVNADGKTVSQTHGTLCPVAGCFMTGRPTYEFFREQVLTKNKQSPTSTSTIPVPTSK